MPAVSQKQKRFFGAVMGAKKGAKGIKGAAKKAAKEMPEKEVKKFLKTKKNAPEKVKESFTFDDLVNQILND